MQFSATRRRPWLAGVTTASAARRQGVAPERISFIDALRWTAHARPGDELPELVVVPRRPGRFEPRARKRRPKEYDLLNKPRAILREALRAKSLTP